MSHAKTLRCFLFPAFVPVGLVLILLGNALFLHYNAFRCFNTWDMSYNLDAAWRVSQGQRPYIDFSYCFGPVHLYMQGLFFGILGFGKTAVLAHLVVISSALIVLVFGMTYRRLPALASLGLCALTAMAFYWPISHPWHDQSAHFWGLLGVALLLREEWVANVWGRGLLLGILAGLAIMTKTNIGAAYAGLYALVLLLMPGRIKHFASYLVGIVACFGMLALVNPPLAFWNDFSAYTSLNAGGRLKRLLSVQTWLTNYYWMPLVVVLATAWPVARKDMMLLAGLCAVGIFSAVTGGMIPQANIFLWGPVMAAAFVMMYQVPLQARQRRWGMGLAMLLVLLAAGSVVAAKYGLELKVWSYRKVPGTYALKTAPMDGWLFPQSIGPRVDEIADFIKTRVPKEESLLIATDLQFLYALTGRDSYRGVPVYVFSTQLAPVPGRQQQQVAARVQANLPQWILTDLEEYVEIWPYIGITPQLRRQYVLAKDFGPYALFRKR